MKKALSSFDVSAIVKELARYEGWRIDKAYQPSARHLVLAVRSPREGKEYIHFVVGEWLFASRSTKEMPKEPSDFVMMLRKRITNAKISGIRQQGFDRIAVIDLEKDERYQLVLEMFGKGNVILVKDDVIVQPLTSRAWRHRDVRAKRPFEFPPAIPDPTELDVPRLLNTLAESDSDLVRTLATKLNLGGKYSEETCKRAGLSLRQPAKDVSEEDASLIIRSMKAVAEEAKGSSSGFIVAKRGELVDVVPIRMEIYGNHDVDERASFSEAIEEYVGRVPEPSPKKDVVAEAGDQELERLKRKLTQQERAALALQTESVEARAAGDALYTKYADISHTLMMAKDLLLQNKSLDELPGFVSFDKKKALLRIEIDSAVYELDVNGTVESNARRFYEKGKKLKGKLEGVLPALEETRAAVTERKYNRLAAEKAQGKPEPKASKRFWFERYRWFISSEGAIVLGGKDAKTNDMLVKKHLEAGDRYAHADIHGAPSVVVKMREGVTETTLVEACEFAIATSKAWNAKIGSAAGYWVLPEQVSKTPQSGEYLARGAFVIRGKRNYSPKAEIMLGIGETTFEGEKKIMCAPVSAVKASCTRYVIIKPGATDKNLFAKKFAEEFEVPIEEAQSVLPPGDVDIVERHGTGLEINPS